MASAKRYRKISTCIWNDEKVASFSLNGKLVLLFMLTHPSMTMMGAMRANVPGLACELGMDLEAFKEAFKEALDQGIAKYDGRLLIWFPNFLKYNMPESLNAVKSWATIYEELPGSPMKEEVLKNAEAALDGASEAFRKAFREAFGKARAIQRTENREQKTEKEEKTYMSTTEVADAPVSSPPDSPPEIMSNPEPGEEKPTTSGVPPCPYTAIVNLYNSTLPMLTQVKQLTPARKERMKIHWRGSAEKRDLGWWEKFFQIVARCPFLHGESDKGGQAWSANFDWLLKPTNMVKVLEGNYLPKAPAGNKADGTDEFLNS